MSKINKYCKVCGSTKDINQFWKDWTMGDGLSSRCIECDKAKHRKYYKSNQEKILKYRQESRPKRRQNHLIKKYGVTLKAYEEMLAAQSGLCAICKTPEAEVSRSRLHVDHDHETNRVRGLLCFSCNMGVGYFKNKQELLSSAMVYLSLNNDITK